MRKKKKQKAVLKIKHKGDWACPKCKHSVGTPIGAVEVKCLPCGVHMKPLEVVKDAVTRTKRVPV